ncbi:MULTISPECIES: PadR family transcriptional regulator [Streptomyces]|uniref:PadR family transcriptional regulator n=1 Tax=Streptomyces lycii TaxID=2654337 RepID=A0ABQ7FJW1_9ACTN|nr:MULTISPECIES: PadR family transcriptional regulator [Streptomyces]KAF4409125.1 PadR family transcriptional regulator [Streptomyces lycii]PGH48083.1 PadR family transcriptional regulator [Streptomyces sp. Ru87]
MALEHAILVSLLERPGSGYELARRFEQSAGTFWTAPHQQIYRVLKRMERDGRLRVDEVAQQGKPDKKVYSVTADGRAALGRWLDEPVEPGSGRRDLAVKIRGAAFGGDRARLVAEAERHRQAHAELLNRCLAVERRDFPDASERDTGQELRHVVLRGGIEAERATVAWLDDVIATLRRIGEAP